MRFNKFNLTIGILYCIGFVLILLNFLTKWLNLAALCVFIVATIMLTISLTKFCIQRNAYLTSQNEEIIMEMALVDGVEKFVPKEKKQSRFKKFIENIRIFSPAILSGMIGCLLVVLLILSLI